MIIDELEKNKNDDIELMAAIARGSKTELGRLYMKHKDSILALAYRILGQWNLAEDVCQEVFLRIYKSADKYKPDSEFKAWLYRVTVNLCIDQKRKIKRSSDLVYIHRSVRNNRQNPANKENTDDVSEIVWKAIEKLKKRQKIVVKLHKIEGLTHKEISKKTGWSRSSIESLLVRAYRKLRNELITSYGAKKGT